MFLFICSHLAHRQDLARGHPRRVLRSPKKGKPHKINIVRIFILVWSLCSGSIDPKYTPLLQKATLPPRYLGMMVISTVTTMPIQRSPPGPTRLFVLGLITFSPIARTLPRSRTNIFPLLFL